MSIAGRAGPGRVPATAADGRLRLIAGLALFALAAITAIVSYLRSLPRQRAMTAADAVVSVYLHACDCVGDAHRNASWPRSSASAAPESPPWSARLTEPLTWPAASLRSAGRRSGPVRGGGELYYRGRSPAPSAAFVADGGQPGLTAPASPALVMPEPVAIMAVQAARS